MDLCGPMRVASVNGKKYILVIVDDYSRFTWVKFLRSKDEAPDFIIKFLKMIQLRLKVPVRRIRIDNGTEFVNQTLREYYEKGGISHETSVARSLQQNGVVERRNHSLIEVARTMLIYVRIHQKSQENSQKRASTDMRIKRVQKEAKESKPKPEMSSLSQKHSIPALHEITPATISSKLVPNPPPSTLFVPPSRTDWDMLFQPLFDKLLNPPPSVDHPTPKVVAPIDEVAALEPAVSTMLGIIINRLKSGSYRVKSGRHIRMEIQRQNLQLEKKVLLEYFHHIYCRISELYEKDKECYNHLHMAIPKETSETNFME
ncbi:retrovirus-related pol polyprotein from transposon TNT 1-94 [Tanacetum coccineum]